MIHGLHSLSPDAEQPLRAVRLWDCGVTWRDLNPSKGEWTWSNLDQAIRPNHHYLYVLGATPQWAAKYKTAPHFAPWLGAGSNSPPADLRDWDEYVRRVATRYKGRITAYQIWNEPQLRDFWYPEGYITLGTMTKRAYNIIKEIDPHTKVVAPPILPRPSSGGIKRGTKILSQLKAKGWPVDVYAIHCYPEEGYGAARTSWMISQMKKALTALDAPTKPLWITEINYNLLNGALSLPNQMDLIQGTDIVGMGSRITRCYWYAMDHSDPNLLGVTFSPDSLTTKKLGQLNS